MRNLIKRRNFWILLSSDVLLVGFAYFLSYWIRFEGDIPPDQILNFRNTIWFVIPFKIVTFFLFQLYKGMWRYTGVKDLISIVRATLASSAAITLTILYIYRFEGFPRSVFAIDALLTLIFIGGIRFLIRLFLQSDLSNAVLDNHFPFFHNGEENVKRLLIIGAGDAGEKILRQIHGNPRLKYKAVGFVDDDSNKHGMRIHEVPIIASIDQLSFVAKHYKVDELLIAIATADRKEIRRIVNLCQETGLKFRIIPGISELLDGRLTVQSIREVAYEDLMGRQPVRLNMEMIGEYLKGKSILVTGAGGSIGSELSRQVARFLPKRLILFDCTENNLYEIENEMKVDFPYLRYEPILGNIVNRHTLKRVFSKYRPQVVFHAAAYKHVPMMELNPWEAVFTNVRGTQNLLEFGKEFGVERFVLVSTDKAVRPSNVMGATKRVAELLIQCYNGSCHPSRFMAVRFGNVIGSSGSVVPLFKKQIARGGPVTVTHPEMTRYFMSISEAAQLILQTGAMGDGGDIFVLDMGFPMKIHNLARDLIRLSGFEPDEDVKIVFTGLRPGEKIYEELITDGEDIVPTGHEKIMVLRKSPCEMKWLNEKIYELIILADEHNTLSIKKKLKEILPEYEPSCLNDEPES
jgi:FlaA1/EpsC-like NDP-sugar epimerase